MEPTQLISLANKIKGLCCAEDCLILYNLIKNLGVKGAALEIGSFEGRVTICLAKALEEENKGHLYTIDADILGIKDNLLKNISDFEVKNRVTPIFKYSAIANIGWKEPINFLWMDVDGNYLSWLSEYLLWEPHLVKGGVLAFSGASCLSTQRILNNYVIKSGRFRDVTIAGSIAFAYKDRQEKHCSISKINTVRFLSFIYYSLRKYFYKFRNIPYFFSKPDRNMAAS